MVIIDLIHEPLAFVAACPCNHTGDDSSIVLAVLSKHTIFVHSDNTSTVHPYILVNTTVGIDNNNLQTVGGLWLNK